MIQNVRKPQRDVVADFDAVCKVRRRLQVKSALLDIRKSVLDSYSAYEAGLGSPLEVNSLDLAEDVARALRENYVHTYDNSVLSQLRADALAAVDGERCPMCGAGFVSDLDHYLPKEKYPEFSVLALNLVPVCNRCNKKKLSLVGSVDGRFFHAYYDDVPTSPSILIANLELAENSVIVSFKINDKLSKSIYRDALYQFEKLRLAEAYVAPAIQDLIIRILSFEQLYQIGGLDAVAHEASKIARHLREEFGSQFWLAALYDAVKANHDFCDGGFRVLFSRNPEDREAR